MATIQTTRTGRTVKSSITNISRRAFLSTHTSMDWVLVSVVIILTLIGLVMAYSTTFYDSAAYKGTPLYQFESQLKYALAGLALMFVLSRIDYGFWNRWAFWLMIAMLVVLVLVLMFGMTKYGAKRSFSDGSYQPSEAAKIIILLYAATWLASRREDLAHILTGVVPFAVILAIGTVLIFFEPDLSTTAIILIAAFAMFFMAGARIHHLALVVGLAILLVLMVMNVPMFAHVADRMRDYLNSMKDGIPHEQIQQSMAAFKEGGLFGVGVGMGFVKYNLYTAHTDSVFAVLADETGLLGLAVTLGLFVILVYRAFHIATNADSYMGAYWAVGLSTWIIMQTLLNGLAMVGLIPLPGIPVPFLSIGGSSLISVMGACGILLSISRGSKILAQTEKKKIQRKKEEPIARSRGTQSANPTIRRRYSGTRSTRTDRAATIEDRPTIDLIGRDVKFAPKLGTGPGANRNPSTVRWRNGRYGAGSGLPRGR
jgi:cell division protein FtsW